MSMNPLQQKVFDHLTAPGASRERRNALASLVTTHFFACSGESTARTTLDRWVNDVAVTRWCNEGVERFKNAVGLHPKTKTVTVTLEIETDSNLGQLERRSRENPPNDYELSDSAARAILNAETLNKSRDGRKLPYPFNVVSVKAVSGSGIKITRD